MSIHIAGQKMTMQKASISSLPSMSRLISFDTQWYRTADNTKNCNPLTTAIQGCGFCAASTLLTKAECMSSQGCNPVASLQAVTGNPTCWSWALTAVSFMLSSCSWNYLCKSIQPNCQPATTRNNPIIHDACK